MSLQDPPYKIVLERSATFQHYYLIHVYPPAPLTLTFDRRKLRTIPRSFGDCYRKTDLSHKIKNLPPGAEAGRKGERGGTV